MVDADATSRGAGTDAELRGERNLAAIEARARVARRAATALIGVGALALVGWLWTAVRAQTELAPYGFPLAGYDSVTVAQRVDLLTSSLAVLVYSVVAIALGMFLKLAVDHIIARSGGSLPRLPPSNRP